MTGAPRPVRLQRAGDRRVDLTPLQARVWASDRLLAGEPVANMGHRYRMPVVIDPERFIAAVDRVVAESDVLRFVIDPSADAIVGGWVGARPPRRTEVVRLDANDLSEWSAERIARVMDPTECVYDSVLLRHDHDDWSWWMCVHHAATDAASAGLIADAVFAAYDFPDDPLPVDGSFFDAEAIAAARAAAGSHERSEGEAAGEPLAWYGPTGAPTPVALRHEVDADDAMRSRLLELLDTDLRSISRELGLLAAAASACALLAHRFDGRDRLTIGVPIHHRSTRSTRRVVGPLMEIHPLVVGVEPGDSFRELHQRTVRSVMDLLREATPGSAPTLAPEIVVNVVRRRVHTVAGVDVVDTWVRPGRIEPTTKFRLHLVEQQGADGRQRLEIELDENGAFRPDGLGPGPAQHLERAFVALVDDPDAPISDVAVVTAAEVDAHRALSPSPLVRALDEPVAVGIARRLADDPTAVVAEDVEGEVTAAEFDRRCAVLSDALIDRGVGPRDRVGVRLRRSVDVLVALNAVHRVGASFVMLSPDDPDDRIDAIALDATLITVLDEDAVVGSRTAVASGRFVAAGESRHVWGGALDLDHEAYVLYTSGSTGAPKGVPISQRGLADYLEFAIDEYMAHGDGDGDGAADPPVIALHSELVFDLTVTSLFIGLLAGGRTVAFDGTPIEVLRAVAHDDRITFLKATPSQLELYLRLVPSGLRPLSCIVVGGEAFRRPLAERLRAATHAGVRIFNEYGPTEAVVGCMIHEWDPDRDLGPDVPIGVASDGAQLAVLDPAGRIAPAGGWGELWVRRPGMAQEYLGLPDLSAERFVELPSSIAGDSDSDTDGQPERWYRTGDRVRMERPGVLVYGGRQDDQLKVRGVRLEPGEVESALVEHPDVELAVVRSWRPADQPPPPESRRCARCGLGTDVPGVTLSEGMCNVCHDFDAVAPQAEQWFRTDADLDRELLDVRASHDGPIDCLHLLSGGKDSTYALYQLVERGWRVHALTLDNGFISDGAKENVRRSIADLGITHEFATTDAMNEIFRDSLDRYANVCQGCYKTIYTLAVARARALDIPVIVTGLSRGQFFETRLIPHQFESDRFDADAIDATVLEARRVYHQTDDAVTRLLPEQAVFDEPDVFERVRFLDFYRYVDVDLESLYGYLEEHAPWVRPADTGRSTNCLINVAGIHVHRSERGYHNYAEPYSWDVRLGHKTRDEALYELDDPMDPDEIDGLLTEIAYAPKSVELLTAWYRSRGDIEVDPEELRAHLRERLPAHAIPQAFVRVDDVPLASGTKVDVASLPTPVRVTRSSGDVVEPTTPIESALCRLWRDVLGVERVGVTDDFFDLGGASLAALSVVAAIDAEYDTDLPDAAVFRSRTVRDLAALVERSRSGGGGRHPIEPLDPSAPLPRSEAEEAMLFEYRLDPADPRYNVTWIHRVPPSAVDGGEAPVAVDRHRLVESLADVAMLHDPLHVAHDGSRRRLGRDEAIDVVDLGVVSAAEMHRLGSRVQRMPFDLDRGPLLRVHHGVTEDGEVLLLVGVHHISIDARTVGVLWRQVAARHEHGALPELPVLYAEHGAWQRDRLDDVHAAGRGHWLAAADARPEGLGLPFGRPVPAEPDGYVLRPTNVKPEQLASAGATPFTRAVAAVAATLSSASRRPAVEFGIAIATNDHPAVDEVVGYFLNTLPLVVPASPSTSMRQVVATAAEQIAELVPHRRYPFARIVRDARDAGAVSPSVDVMLAYQEFDEPMLLGRPVDHQILATGSSVADCTFFVHEHSDRLDVAIEYRGSVLGRRDAERLLDTFERALVATVDDPGSSVLEATAWAVEPDLVGPGVDTELGGRPVVDSVLDTIDAHPDALATLDGRGAMTRGDLAVAVDELCSELDALDAAGRSVVVELSRSSSVIVAMLACWASGARYVPIDPNSPRRRRGQILDAVDPVAVITDDENATPSDTRAQRFAPIVLGPAERGHERDRVVASLAELRRRVAGVSLDHEAYVIFTSGSTGTPKGVVVDHGNLAASTAARFTHYGREPRRFLVTSSIGFDSSLVGLVWPLVSGGAVVLPDDAVVADLDRLADTIARTAADHVLMVPSLYRALLDRRPERLVALDTAIVAGEAVPAQLVDDHHARLPGVDLVNEYGPTEATVWSTVHRLEAGEPPVIGRPIAGVTARIVDEHQSAVPAGAAGELLVSGPTVTVGYLADEVATNAAFIELDGVRWYRTGDLVRANGDGPERLIVFLGRSDEQLNVGGNRLEPGEVEAAIDAIEGVRESAVIAAGDPPRVEAHIVLADGQTFDERAVRRVLGAELPVRSVPSRFVVRDDLPHTSRGKVDRRRLTAEAQGATASTPLIPASPPPPPPTAGGSAVEGAELVLEVWADAFGRTDLTIDTDFFDAGGDSLIAVSIVMELGERVGVEVPIADVLVGRTPRGMARLLADVPPVAVGTPRHGAADRLDTETRAGPTQQGASEDGVTLATVRAAGASAPLVIMTAAWDDPFGYQALADALPADFEVVALTIDPTSDVADARTVDGFAARAMRLVQNHLASADHADPGSATRPVVLIGWSIGGLAAVEVAARLRQSGRPPTLLALVDTYFPGEQRHIWSSRWSKYRSLVRPGGGAAIAAEVRATVRRRVGPWASRAGRRLLAWSGGATSTPAAQVSAAPRRSVGVPAHIFDHPIGHIDGRVLFVSASSTSRARTTRHWTRVASEIDIVTVDGRHRGFASIMHADRVGGVAEAIVGALPPT